MGLDELPPCPTDLFLEIEAGDTLAKIAEEQGVTVEGILALNPGLDPLNLRIGSFICLPLPTEKG
ncbi:MAG: LysM peptidoglycan-binding domain-containing protein [Dethiobacter sp.]|jgi:LysM repeat protein|nr:LysM peptidoglycan-binding domain-containing protein [Dethiobacter sp.]MBS3901559.1 LysM peptidoglycan-binding domain-containing protein [Dethiobacter sp.]MBS3989419.1 LysM peptidoglycan-binding domain-containing protein [Dethiobacter sp.]